MSRAIALVVCVSVVGCTVSIATSAEPLQQQNVVYAETAGVGLVMDIYTSSGPKNGLAIVDVVSGGWDSSRGKIRDHERAQIFRILCERGYTVFAVRPGSLSKFSIPDMVEHVQQAIVWVKEHADQYQIDISRIGLTGASAGGHLASLVAVKNENSDVHPGAELSSVKAVAVFFPPTDLVEYGAPSPAGEVSSLARRLAFPAGTEGVNEEEIKKRLTDISPARLVTPHAPPFLLIHGTADMLVPLEQSEKFAKALRNAGVSVELLLKEGGAHPWPTIHEEVGLLADWFDQQLDNPHTAADAGTAPEPTNRAARQPASTPRYLILHADDAGMSHSVNVGTIEAMEHGLVNSVSVMVPCPWIKEFADYCRAHPDGDYGIHLTLNSEWDLYRWGPVAARDQVPSLVDEHGYLWSNVAQVVQHVKLNEAVIELRAQIDRALELGIPLSHLDTHMGALVSRPDLLKAYVDLGIEYDLPVMFIDTSDQETIREYPALVELGDELQRRLATKQLPVLDRLLQFYGGESEFERRQVYVNALRSLQPGVTQLIVHCGVDGAELQAVTSSARRRDEDRRIFCDPDIAALLQELDIKLITWKDFRRMSSQE